MDGRKGTGPGKLPASAHATPGSQSRNHQARSGQQPKGGDGSAERALFAARVAGEFPAPLRVFVLFLEAADSHAVNAHLLR